MKYTVIIQKDPESGWYVGQCEQVPGAISQGETFEELMENMKDAISLMLEYYRDELSGLATAVPRHPEIKDLTCERICKQLGIPYPGKN